MILGSLLLYSNTTARALVSPEIFRICSSFLLCTNSNICFSFVYQGHVSNRHNSNIFSLLISGVLFPCQLCGKEYNTRSGLFRHRKFQCPYENKAPIIRCIYCEYTNRRPDQIRLHMKRSHAYDEF